MRGVHAFLPIAICENSGKNSGHLAVMPIAEMPATQHFHGE
jgi:hypothetical protein